MKVLYVSHEAALNGAPRSLLEYLRVIKNKGVTPIVILPKVGLLKDELDKDNIENIVIPYDECVYTNKPDIEYYIKYIRKNSKAILEIKEYIIREKIDLVHSNSFAVDVGAIASILAHVPHIWHLREYMEEDFDFKLMFPKLASKLIQKSKCCIAISRGIQQKYAKKYQKKSILLVNGLEYKRYYVPVSENQQISDSEHHILIAGTILEGKGQWDAIRAVEILVNQGMKVHLHIVGDGRPKYVNQLKKYVRIKHLKSNISFVRYTKDLSEMRKQSKMVLVCSRMEAFGRVTAEAMLAGKIVVGANSGGTLELIGENEERGYLYQANNPNSLADKIIYVLNHPKEVEEKEKLAQKYVLELTDLDKYTDTLLKIYKKVR